MRLLDVLWIFIIISTLQPMLSQKLLNAQRSQALRGLEKRRGSRVITLIHRTEGMGFLGIPFSRFIDIEDSEAVIRAIELTDKGVPIDLVVHTPGGLVLAAEQIASCLADHPAPVTVFVPHYAMSGGTLIALAADQIVMSPSAVLGPIDPQIGNLPAASIMAAVRQKDVNEVDDQTLIMADVASKAQVQVRESATQLLRRHMPPEEAEKLATTLSEGRWTHDFPIEFELARSLGLPVSTDLPDQVRKLMSLYPQPRGRRPSVEYIPAPYGPPERPAQPAPPRRRAVDR